MKKKKSVVYNTDDNRVKKIDEVISQKKPKYANRTHFIDIAVDEQIKRERGEK